MSVNFNSAQVSAKANLIKERKPLPGFLNMILFGFGFVVGLVGGSIIGIITTVVDHVVNAVYRSIRLDATIMEATTFLLIVVGVTSYFI